MTIPKLEPVMWVMIVCMFVFIVLVLWDKIIKSEGIKCWCCRKPTLQSIQAETFDVMLCRKCVQKLFHNREFKKNIANATDEVQPWH